MHEKSHVLKVLEETKEAVKREDTLALKDLSNQTIHTASTEQDTDSILLAIIIYSLGKIIERKSRYNKKECAEFCRFAVSEIDKAIKSLNKDDVESFKKSLESIINSINKLSGSYKKDIENVLRKARINKASKIYEHGISMEQTAKLLGITMYELAPYAGQSGNLDVPLARTQSVKDRIKLAMDFFER